MTRVVACADPRRALEARTRGYLGVALYESGGSSLAGLGRSLPYAVRQLPAPPSQAAWDFLSLSLAVFAADRMIRRAPMPDGWTRVIALEVEVAEPHLWSVEADPLGRILRFLTGDIWYLHFNGGGRRVPEFRARTSERDCACLFSGGLDSFMGAADLLFQGRNPLIVSEAFPKEGAFQVNLARSISLNNHRFVGKVSERYVKPYEPSSRSRSMLFIAYGVLAATSLIAAGTGNGELFIPENGLISINPPFTRRRLGSLSTRTTHPHFIALLQRSLHRLGLTRISLLNPFQGMTKGEILLNCRHPRALHYAASSYSCAKGKRRNMHCGRCVPCLIRRAAFQKAGLDDRTPYSAQNLAEQATFDDVFAARLAIAQLAIRDVAQWAREAGPLPDDRHDRLMCIEVVRRGIVELRDFLDTVNWS
jgi:hypothetical protein